MSPEPNEVTCPECGTAVEMGLPQDRTVVAVTPSPDPDLDEQFAESGGTSKRRSNRCPRGHSFYVYFEFGRGSP